MGNVREFIKKKRAPPPEPEVKVVEIPVVGPCGPQGDKGERGECGEKGEDGDHGRDGRDGRDGKDADEFVVKMLLHDIDELKSTIALLQEQISILQNKKHEYAFDVIRQNGQIKTLVAKEQ